MLKITATGTAVGDGVSSQTFVVGIEPTSLRLERRSSRQARPCLRRLTAETSTGRRRPHRFRFVVFILVGSPHHVGEGAGEEGSIEERRERKEGEEKIG